MLIKEVYMSQEVKSKIEDPRGRIASLFKFIKGITKELGKYCIQMDPVHFDLKVLNIRW